jgi:hypothetical protein
MHVILQDVVASPRIVIPSMLMIPLVDKPVQVTFDVDDKFDPQAAISATPQ